MLSRTVSAPRLIMRPPSALFTCAVIFRNHMRAFVALHRAAPVKFAVAAADNLDAFLHHSEAAFITQPAATLPLPIGHVLVTLQTLPPLCALIFQALVFHAVIRGILQVNELRPRDAPKCVCNGSSVVCAVPSSCGLLVHLQFLRMFVLHLQVVAYLSEVSQLHPASLDAATPRHSVTLACFPHGSFDCLPRKFGKCYLKKMFGFIDRYNFIDFCVLFLLFHVDLDAVFGIHVCT